MISFAFLQNLGLAINDEYRSRSHGKHYPRSRMWISNQGRNCLAKQLLLWYPRVCTDGVNPICLAARQIQDMCHENTKTITDSHCMCRLFLFELSNTFCILNTHRQASRRFLPRKLFPRDFCLSKAFHVATNANFVFPNDTFEMSKDAFCRSICFYSIKGWRKSNGKEFCCKYLVKLGNKNFGRSYFFPGPNTFWMDV